MIKNANRNRDTDDNQNKTRKTIVSEEEAMSQLMNDVTDLNASNGKSTTKKPARRLWHSKRRDVLRSNANVTMNNLSNQGDVISTSLITSHEITDEMLQRQIDEEQEARDQDEREYAYAEDARAFNEVREAAEREEMIRQNQDRLNDSVLRQGSNKNINNNNNNNDNSTQQRQQQNNTLSIMSPDMGDPLRNKTPVLTSMEWRSQPLRNNGSVLFSLARTSILKEWERIKSKSWSSYSLSRNYNYTDDNDDHIEQRPHKRRKLTHLNTPQSVAHRDQNQHYQSQQLESFGNQREGIYVLGNDYVGPHQTEHGGPSLADHAVLTNTTFDNTHHDTINNININNNNKSEEKEVKDTNGKDKTRIYKALANNPYSLMNLGNLGASEPLVEMSTPWDLIQSALVTSSGIQEEGYYCYWIKKRFDQWIRRPINKELKKQCLSLSENINENGANVDQVIGKIKALEKKFVPKYSITEIETFRSQNLDPMRDREKLAAYFKIIPEFIIENCLAFKKVGEVDEAGKDIWKIDPVSFRIANEASKTYQNLTSFKPEQSPYTNKTAALNFGHRIMSNTLYDTFTGNLVTSDDQVNKRGRPLFGNNALTPNPSNINTTMNRNIGNHTYLAPPSNRTESGEAVANTRKRVYKTNTTVRVSSKLPTGSGMTTTTTTTATKQQRMMQQTLSFDFNGVGINSKIFDSNVLATQRAATIAAAKTGLKRGANGINKTTATGTNAIPTKQVRKKQVGTEKSKKSAQIQAGSDLNALPDTTLNDSEDIRNKSTYLTQFNIS